MSVIKLVENIPNYIILAYAIKHSGTEEIIIELKSNCDTLALTVTDKGKGFNTNQENDGHYGLVNLRKRASALNGELSIESVMGKGSSIHLEMKIKDNPSN